MLNVNLWQLGQEDLPEYIDVVPVLLVKELLVQVGQVEVDDDVVEELPLLQGHVVIFTHTTYKNTC